jgi:hypothetical protein
MYNPTATDLRNAYEVAYGEYGLNVLLGMFYTMTTNLEIERLYASALDKVKKDMEKKELV